MGQFVSLRTLTCFFGGGVIFQRPQLDQCKAAETTGTPAPGRTQPLMIGAVVMYGPAAHGKGPAKSIVRDVCPAGSQCANTRTCYLTGLCFLSSKKKRKVGASPDTALLLVHQPSHQCPAVFSPLVFRLPSWHTPSRLVSDSEHVPLLPVAFLTAVVWFFN